MSGDRDPIEVAAEEGRDLYDIASWEPRSRLDRLSVRLYHLLLRGARALVVVVGLLIIVGEFALTGLAIIAEPVVGVYVLFSVLPALGVAGYLWRADVTMREPLDTLLVTFLLGVLFAGFAAVLNAIADPLFSAIPYVGLTLFFYLVVAPVEEAVKWLAIRLYAFRTPEFDAVIDGAVYGAVAGLGFATIENTAYIGQQYLESAGSGSALVATFRTAAVRSLAGPGHVIYSAFAGYYLGLAKYNRENAGPIVVKGLLIAALAHGTYNTLVGIVPGLIGALAGVGWPVAFLGFILAYDGALGYVLYRKVTRYGEAYDETIEGRRDDGEPEGEGDGELGENAVDAPARALEGIGAGTEQDATPGRTATTVESGEEPATTVESGEEGPPADEGR